MPAEEVARPRARTLASLSVAIHRAREPGDLHVHGFGNLEAPTPVNDTLGPLRRYSEAGSSLRYRGPGDQDILNPQPSVFVESAAPRRPFRLITPATLASPTHTNDAFIDEAGSSSYHTDPSDPQQSIQFADHDTSSSTPNVRPGFALMPSSAPKALMYRDQSTDSNNSEPSAPWAHTAMSDPATSLVPQYDDYDSQEDGEEEVDQLERSPSPELPPVAVLSPARHDIATADVSSNRWEPNELADTYPKTVECRLLKGSNRSGRLDGTVLENVICGAQFDTPEDLGDHLTTVHKITTNKVTDGSSSICAFGECQKALKSASYRRHLESQLHFQVRFRCPFKDCEVKYSRTDLLRAHIKGVHSAVVLDLITKECGGERGFNYAFAMFKPSN